MLFQEERRIAAIPRCIALFAFFRAMWYFHALDAASTPLWVLAKSAAILDVLTALLLLRSRALGQWTLAGAILLSGGGAIFNLGYGDTRHSLVILVVELAVNIILCLALRAGFKAKAKLDSYVPPAIAAAPEAYEEED